MRVWAHDPRSVYEDLGRPTIRKPGERLGSTLDFTLRNKVTGKVFVAEMKCEIEYRNYRYLVLSDAAQLAHHTKPAFKAFLDVAAGEPSQKVCVGGKEVPVDGAILIWGAATAEGREAVVREYGISEVLSIAEIIDELRAWETEPYLEFIEQRRQWANELFDALGAPPESVAAPNNSLQPTRPKQAGG